MGTLVIDNIEMHLHNIELYKFLILFYSIYSVLMKYKKISHSQ